MPFTEVIVVGIIFSTVGFIFKQFFDYLRFRRTKAVGDGDYEQLEASFREYARRTSRRIEHLEEIIADHALETPKKHEILDFEDELQEMESEKMKNRLETR